MKVFGIKSAIIIAAFFGFITISLYLLSGNRASYATYSGIYLLVLVLYLIFFVKLFIIKGSFLIIWSVFKKRNISKQTIAKIILFKNSNRGGLDQVKFIFTSGLESTFHTKIQYFEINKLYQSLIAEGMQAEFING